MQINFKSFQDFNSDSNYNLKQSFCYLEKISNIISLLIKDVIEDSLLKQISAVLKILVEAFQNFDEEQAINIISNTFGEHAFANSFNYGTINIHPIDKLIQLHEEKIALY